jgi:proline iminopeptidase
MIRRVLRWLGGLVALILLAIGALWVVTMGDYPVPATVTQDADLPRLEVGGVTLHAQGFGNTADPAIVVLHGGPGGDHRSLLPLAELSDTHRVTFYDQRGAGLSERVPPEALTLQAHIEELSGVLDAVSPDAPAILIGHSWGAMLASAYLGQHPERVAAAVLIEPGFLSAAEFDAWNARAQEVIRQPAMLWLGLRTGFEAAHVDGPDPDASRDYLIGQMIHAFASDPMTTYACPGMEFDSPAWRAGSAASREVAARATAEDLDALGGNSHRFSGPVLMLTGACSTWIGEDLQREHLDLFTNARLEVIPGAGHDTVDDAPEATLAAIRAFLTEPR